MRDDDARARATEFVKELYAAGDIDAGQLETGVAELIAAKTHDELALVVRSLPTPVAFTMPDRRLSEPLRINGGLGGMRLRGHWQIAKETHVSAEIGNVRIDLTEAEFDDDVVDLHVYTGWGNITIVVARGVAVQVMHHRGGLVWKLEPPVPGFPLVRLDVTTNIGRVRVRHPDAPGGTRRRGSFRRS
jgi:hypothetical protein